MVGSIILWLVSAFTIIWAINWIIHHRKSRGHFWAIVEVILMWVLIIYFFSHPSISRYHLIWAAPVTFFIGFLVSGIFMRSKRDDVYSNDH